MSDITNWLQGNWFELGSLLIQCAILATLVWYGSKILSFVRAFFQYREIFRQRLELSVTTEPAYAGGAPSGWREFVRWLQAPMGSGGPGLFHRIITWLQAPMI